jgi:hypothetical protein
MNNFKILKLKPFECVYIDSDSIYINYGTVICTATNSLQNTFIPKDKFGIELKSPEDNFKKQSNIVDIKGSSKGCICLKINLKSVNLIANEKYEEWKSSLFSKSDENFKIYLQKYISKTYVDRVIGDLESLNFGDPALGIEEKMLVPLSTLVDPKDPNAEEIILQLENALKEEKQRYKDGGIGWKETYSQYYGVTKKITEDNKDKKYLAQPKEYILKPSMLPMVNFSSPILDVSIEFVPFSQNKEKEEKEIKYNFILNDTKLVPIAYFDSSSTKIIEQIIDFDYVFNFPFYYNQNLISDFLKKEEA